MEVVSTSNIGAYKKAIYNTIPQVFSFLDREPMSKTYGSADRVFWSWKFIDFPGSRFQEITYVLAELATNPLWAGAYNWQQNTLVEWAKAAINYWCTLQYKDGSFDEAYPYERSLAATAFTSFYVGRAFIKIKPYFSTQEQQKIINTFKKAGIWLCNNDENHGVLSNHLAAAAAALDTIAEITSASQFIERRTYFINKILSHQSSEGWYEEYGGADPGYQTHTTFYLGYVWSLTKNQQLLDSLIKSVKHFWHFIHIDGSIGGEYGSRNTRFFMPAGFEILANVVPEAGRIAYFMRDSLANQHVIGLHAMDQYNVFPLLNNYLFAMQFATTITTEKLPILPCYQNYTKHFPESGHFIFSTENYQAIIATTKGGVISIFPQIAPQNTSQWSNAGIAVEFSNGKKASSQGLGCSELVAFKNNTLEISSKFVTVNQMVMTPGKFIAFRIVSFISAPIPKFAYWLKKLLVKVLVNKKRPIPIESYRTIKLGINNISIKDKIILKKPCKIKNIFFGGRFSAIHMGSSRYFEWQELSCDHISKSLSIDEVKKLNKTRTLVIDSEWSI